MVRNGRLVHEPRKAKHVLLMLGSMRCRYTLDEILEMDRLARTLDGRRLAVLAVLRGKQEEISEWAREKGLAVRLLVDPDGQVLRLYCVNKTPDVYLINADGLVAYRSGGGFLAANQLEPLARGLLAGSGIEGTAFPKPGAG